MAVEHINSTNPKVYAGPLLFRKGRADTPLLSMIGGRRRFVDSEIFILGQNYAAPQAVDSVVSEATAATVVPDFAPVGREQGTNVTEIHTKSVAQTDYSTGNRGMLSGPNLAGQVGNPASELDFQRAIKVQELANDLEKNFIVGEYAYRNGDPNKANHTRGLVQAITTNVMDCKGNEMSWNYLNELLCSIADNGGVTYGLVLGCDTITATQLAIEAKAEHFSVVTGVANINGIGITTIQTVKGVNTIVELRYLPAGTALVLNLNALSIAEQPFENGNWTWFDIGRTAGSKVEMLQGACGLDYGYEGMHGKLVNIAEGYTPYKGTKVYLTNEPVKTTEVVPEISGVALTGAKVGEATPALAVSYEGQPTGAANLTYQWEIGNSAIGIFKEIASATGATYTPVEGDAGKFIRCVVTASGTASGTATSNSKKVAAAD